MRKIVAEALGTAILLAAIVGSGIMGDRLAQGNTAIALLANTIATGTTLVALTHARISPKHSVSSSQHSACFLSSAVVAAFALPFIAAQLLGATAACLLFRWLAPRQENTLA